MTNEELIAKIKAEIERLIEESDFDESANLYSLLSFLDTLESEKPVPADLEEAAGLWYEKCPFPKSTWWDEGEEMKLTDSRETFIAGAKWDRNRILALIKSRISEIMGDAQPKPALRAELEELIKRIKDGQN